MVPLMAKVTGMAVTEARDGQELAPNQVYVIPPSSNLGFSDGFLRLSPRGAPRGQPVTIDNFMEQMAESWGPPTIGVVLSGTLSDGTHGLRAIKAAGGVTFAQDLESAKYMEMPRAAIQNGNVDFVMSPSEIAAELRRLARHIPMAGRPNALGDDESKEELLGRIFQIVRHRTGVDFRLYKRTTLERRIHRRIMARGCEGLEAYVELLSEDEPEAERLYKEILIHVTRFFRDPHVFDELEEHVMPAIFSRREAGEEVRIWVAGCATGEEAYTLAIAFTEYQRKVGSNIPVQIFATDLSDTAVATARAGIYPAKIRNDLSDDILETYFRPLDGGYQVKKAIRSMCIFAVHDLTRDPPFSDIDLVSCRNVLIYMEPPNQQRVLAVLHYALADEGVLMLGTSETPNRLPEYFEPLPQVSSAFSKQRQAGALPAMLRVPAEPTNRTWKKRQQGLAGGDDTDDKLIDGVLLERYVPATLVLGPSMEVLHFRGATKNFLQHETGPATLNVMKLLKDGLAVEVHAAVQECRRTRQRVVRERIRFQDGAEWKRANITVEGLRRGHAELVLVVFEDAPAITTVRPSVVKAPRFLPWGGKAEIHQLHQTIDELEREVDAMRAYVQTVTSDYEVTVEQLRCANEESLSSNEELQSTNEELETAKEEAQSTNEELRTLNEELIHRTREIQKANNDLTNLLNSVDIPLVMLNRSLLLTRFTPRANRLLNLIPTDLGRPITDINHPFEGLDLKDEVEHVTETLQVRRQRIRDRTGREYILEVHPYRTSDDQIDGSVLLFLNGAVADDAA